MEVLKPRRNIKSANVLPLQFTYTGDYDYHTTRTGWLLTLQTAGTLTLSSAATVDVCCVGSGGNGLYGDGGFGAGTYALGGGGGHVVNYYAQTLAANTSYIMQFKYNGSAVNPGYTILGTQNMFIITAVCQAQDGSTPTIYDAGATGQAGSGGSGGSALLVSSATADLLGGRDGGNGSAGPVSGNHTPYAGSGQGTTTAPFGSGVPLAAGGNAYRTTPAEDPLAVPNSGNGGSSGFNGSTGVIFIRNHVE